MAQKPPSHMHAVHAYSTYSTVTYIQTDRQCIYIHTHIPITYYPYISIHTHAYSTITYSTCMHTYTYIICTYIHTYVHTLSHTVQLHTYTHAYVCTHTHTHTQSKLVSTERRLQTVQTVFLSVLDELRPNLEHILPIFCSLREIGKISAKS